MLKYRGKHANAEQSEAKGTFSREITVIKSLQNTQIEGKMVKK